MRGSEKYTNATYKYMLSHGHSHGQRKQHGESTTNNIRFFSCFFFYCNTDRELCYSFKDVIPVEHWILVRITGCDREKGGREGLPGNKHSVK